MASSPPTEARSENDTTLSTDKTSRKLSSHKRKRGNDPTLSRKSKKERKHHGAEEETSVAEAEGRLQTSEKANDNTPKLEDPNGENAGYTEEDQATPKTKRKDRSKSSKKHANAEDTVKEAETSDNEKASKKRQRRATAEEEATNNVDPDMKKYASVLSKFSKAASQAEKLKKKAESTEDAQGDEDQQSEEKHGLEPLPQPAPAPESTEKPTYSTLPKWLTEPFLISHSERRNFADLGVHDKLLSVLQNAGYKEAFPIQTAICQLLRPGEHQHTGDICISAATGSGKTLAYALPVVSSMEYSPLPRLRGLIVVPTRELIRQARDTCELLAAGKGLRIGTAVGTASLKEEQAHIMRDDQSYDPLMYEELKKKAMHIDDWRDFNLQQYLSDLSRVEKQFFNYVAQPVPNVDILVCTPGRLVDHLRSTKGFTLEYLQWLIVDEADRLLNESFQEWVDTVIPALNTTPFFRDGKAAKKLANLGQPMRKQQPLRKIILSATMTRDVEKLNSLRLENPRLVVVSAPVADKDEEAAENNISSTDEFLLPPTLTERYIPVGDGSEKPVQLLALLLSKVKVLDQVRLSGEGRASSPSSTSSSSTSDSSDSSDESVSSDSSNSESSDDDDSSVGSESESSDSNTDTESDSGDVSSSEPEQVKSSRTMVNKGLSLPHPTALIFTQSSEAAVRLSRLLAILCPPLSSYLATLTKTNSTRAMRGVISAYRQGSTRVIIATDRASRGLDLPALGHVICYDVPASVTSYVHRIGRTARAGRDGYAWTLVARREGRWFSSEIGGVKLIDDGNKDSSAGKKRSSSGLIKRGIGKKIGKTVVRISEHEDVLGADIKSRYESALAELGAEVAEQDATRRD
ncbi:ATP-dependent RNA helicase dbp6 [Ascosphaera pollenicola]|nr:ATP-dependent RNA helicase dbp6 [Ascosphaera pollenicola]